MGRQKKFAPVPQPTALTVLPSALKPESIEARKREVALLARVKLDDNFDSVVGKIFELSDVQPIISKEGTIVPEVSLDVMRLKLDTLKWLADRGYGKAPQIVKLGSDEGTPEGILAGIARKRTDEMLEKLEAERIRSTAIDTEVVPESK